MAHASACAYSLICVPTLWFNMNSKLNFSCLLILLYYCTSTRFNMYGNTHLKISITLSQFSYMLLSYGGRLETFLMADPIRNVSIFLDVWGILVVQLDLSCFTSQPKIILWVPQMTVLTVHHKHQTILVTFYSSLHRLLR